MPYIGKAPSSGIRSRFIYTATAAQTTFTGADGNGKTLGYTDGEYVDVYLNGVLLDPADYTATSKTSVVLDSGAAASDIVEIVVYDTFSVFNGTFTGDLTVDGDTLFVDASADAVYINKSSSNTGTVGFESRAGGQTVATIDGGTALIANRLTSTGDIQKWMKDGTTVGIAGVDAGGFYLDGEASHTGLRFKGGAVTPRLNAAQADGTVSLGNASEKFNDLYLGGGIQFDSRNNKLDDYEKGDWTPAYSISGATFSYGIQSGKYVKVGDMVVASCRIRGQRSGGSGDLQLTGLPFATSTLTNLNQAATIGFTKNWSTSPRGALTGVNSTIIVFRKSGSTSALSNIADDVTESDVSTSSTSSNDLILTVAYIAA